MSMTRTNAKKYLAKGIGAALNSEVLEMAEEALQRGFSDWQTAKNWFFLLKDTEGGFRVAGCNCAAGTATVTAPSSGAFDGINVGLTVTVLASDTVTLVADTTVLSLTRNTDGTVATITLSNNFGGTNDTSTTLIFTGNLPILVGQQDYNLPTDFHAPYHLRLVGKTVALDYIQYRYWNRFAVDHTVRGLPVAYTVYNALSADTQNFGQFRVRLFRIPDGSPDGSFYDTAILQYYRTFNANSDPLDIPDDYLYKFLDYCQYLLLMKKNAEDQRLSAFQVLATTALQSAMTNDEELTEEEEQFRMISQVESGLIPRPLWSNGQFSTYYGEL